MWDRRDDNIVIRDEDNWVDYESEILVNNWANLLTKYNDFDFLTNFLWGRKDDNIIVGDENNWIDYKNEILINDWG